MESILISIKQMLGIPKEHEHFDPDLIMYINSVFEILTQIGVGPANGFFIEDDTATWKSYIQSDVMIHMVKTYMKLKVQMLFDPPTGSTVSASVNQAINEYECRLNLAAERESTEDDNT